MFSLGGHTYDADDKLEIVPEVHSEVKISDLKQIIDSLCPVQIIIDDKVVWDDYITVNDFNAHMEHYEEVTTSNDIVVNFYFKVVEYHHTIISIHTAGFDDDGGSHGGKNYSQ